MKKSLLALAVLGAFAGAASAQSSVTIYGVVDQGITRGNGGTAVNTSANGLSEAWQIKQARGSRLGFRGNEDLGGGLSAQFLIEHRFLPDTGAAGAATDPFWAGGSYVQLTSAAAGSVYLGRWYTPAFWVALKTDPFGWDGVAQVGSKAWAGYLTGGSGVRTSNTVGYKTPNFSGFTANIATGLAEGSTANRTDGLNAEYTAGPIYVGVGYEKAKGDVASTATSASGDGATLFNIGFAYNFGVVRPIVYFGQSKLGVGNSKKNNYFHLALTAPVGPGQIKAAVGTLDPESTVVVGPSTLQTAEQKQTKISVGYDYFLSKRTRVYADLSQAKEDNRSNNRAYNLGVRHDF
jgi:predicted porin